MNFEKAIKMLERGPNQLVWCPEWSVSRWGKEAIEYLTSCYKKNIIHPDWHWMEWEDNTPIHELWLDYKYMGLAHKLRELTCFQMKWNSTDKEELENTHYYGKLYCGYSTIKFYFKSESPKEE
jgi:hypothetical protein